jgi:predicted metal-binding protein
MAERIEVVKELALACGFTHAGELDADAIQVRAEVRDSCAENKCGAYGTSWSCPPGCGTLEECEKRIRKYRRGLILQTTGILEDSMDYEGMEQAARDHDKNLNAFAKKVRALYPSCMIIGAGACKRCESCTYPGASCRFPETMTSSMEALGMIVSDVCKDNKLPYYYGPNTLTYVGCVLLY